MAPVRSTLPPNTSGGHSTKEQCNLLNIPADLRKLSNAAQYLNHTLNRIAELADDCENDPEEAIDAIWTCSKHLVSYHIAHIGLGWKYRDLLIAARLELWLAHPDPRKHEFRMRWGREYPDHPDYASWSYHDYCLSMSGLDFGKLRRALNDAAVNSEAWKQFQKANDRDNITSPVYDLLPSPHGREYIAESMPAICKWAKSFIALPRADEMNLDVERVKAVMLSQHFVPPNADDAAAVVSQPGDSSDSTTPHSDSEKETRHREDSLTACIIRLLESGERSNAVLAERTGAKSGLVRNVKSLWLREQLETSGG